MKWKGTPAKRKATPHPHVGARFEGKGTALIGNWAAKAVMLRWSSPGDPLLRRTRLSRKVRGTVVMDLSGYQLPLSPVPRNVEDAIGRGTQRGSLPAPSEAAAFLSSQKELGHAAMRAEDGRLLVTTTTELPDVTPDMIDWWFGWHLSHSERYRLWHPTAHVRSVVKEDRSALVGSRECYVNNTSFVDEYIGSVLMKLAISFLPPGEFGFSGDAAGSETVVCARTADRSRHADAGFLVHRVFATPGGSRMQSVFWLGEIMPKVPLLGPLAAALLNRPLMRRLLVPDSLGLALLRHCSEEMNHLAKFLPRLYRDIRG